MRRCIYNISCFQPALIIIVKTSTNGAPPVSTSVLTRRRLRPLDWIVRLLAASAPTSVRKVSYSYIRRFHTVLPSLCVLKGTVDMTKHRFTRFFDFIIMVFMELNNDVPIIVAQTVYNKT